VGKNTYPGRNSIYFIVNCPANEKHGKMAIAVVAVAVGNDIVQLMCAYNSNSEGGDIDAIRKRAGEFLESLKVN
jgi:hypothetical protein